MSVKSSSKVHVVMMPAGSLQFISTEDSEEDKPSRLALDLGVSTVPELDVADNGSPTAPSPREW